MTTGVRFQRGRHLPVGLVLFLFAGQVVAVDEKVFGAEQADAFRAAWP